MVVRPPRQRLEKDEEADARAAAKRLGYVVRKIIFADARGGPDRLFMRASPSRTVWIEFKKAGERPSIQQVRRHEEMRAAGQEVYWVDNWEDALVVLS